MTIMRTGILLAFAMCLASTEAHAATLVEVLPLTDKIVMVHFDDGSVTFAAPGADVHSDVVNISAIDRTAASTAASYHISSADDPAYSTPQMPSSVGRKSKGTEFANHCDSWSGTQCVNSTPDRTLEHWIYLNLPTALQPGKTYTIDTGTLASNTSTTQLTFDVTKVRSEAIHVNTVAYSTKATMKLGYVYHWMGDLGGLDVTPIVGRACHLVRISDGMTVFSATVNARKTKTNVEIAYSSDTPNQNLLGADVADCDFSSFSTPGTYVLTVDAVGSSFPFSIDDDALRKPFYAAMKGLFLHRSGIDINSTNGEGFSRPAPHHPGVTPGFDGKLKYTTTRYFDVSNSDASASDKTTWEAGIKGDIDTWGWYQDAGDWDAYFTHSAIPAWLLTLFEQHPDHFVDGELNIPESGNGIPDVVDEARWLIRFYHRTRHAILDAGWGTGGVGGARVMGDLWGPDMAGGKMSGSWQDTQRQWIVSGEDPWMTYRYAALAAHLATVLEAIGAADPEGIDWRAEAEAAYTWAAANTKAGDETASAFGNPLRDVRMHAELALYRLTGTTSYHDAFKSDFASETKNYGNVQFWALLYPRLPSGMADSSILTMAISILKDQATLELASPSYDRATRWGGNFYMPMFLGEGSTPLINNGVLALEVVDTLTPDQRAAMKARAYTTADYFLGTNPLNMTWISRLGPRYPVGPFYPDGFMQAATWPPMGLIPYGPTGTARDFFPAPPPGPWAGMWANTDVYPTDIETWPGHERWFDARWGITTCEYTIHQNNVLAAIVYGSLLEKPTVIPTFGDGGTIPDGGTPIDNDGGFLGDGSDTPGGGDHGCGCHLTGAPAPVGLLSVMVLLAFILRRRARRT